MAPLTETTMDTLAKRLKAFRQEKHLSAQELAETCGIPVTTYREWENGRQIQGEPYEKLAEALGVSLFELMTGRKPKYSDVFFKLDELEKQIADLRGHLSAMA
ncbi:MAG: helix-turn-helix transcriptional regulator [Bdellovibrio sp.]|nr:helix-turn-helix transcriptional regulator [Bdellovibrio sp.]